MADEYFLGFPISSFFIPDRRKAIVIGCSDYSVLRSKEGMEGFSDIPEALEDIKTVYHGLRRLRFAKNEIIMLEDADYMQVKIAIDSTNNEIYDNYCNGMSTLLFVYYAGHGMMDNCTYSIHNRTDRRWKYPLEKQLRTIAKAEGSYVVAVFDCCREKLRLEQMRGLKNLDQDLLESGVFLCLPDDPQENFIITYGC